MIGMVGCNREEKPKVDPKWRERLKKEVKNYRDYYDGKGLKAPTNLTVTNVDNKYIVLTWDEVKVPNLLGYLVCRTQKYTLEKCRPQKMKVRDPWRKITWARVPWGSKGPNVFYNVNSPLYPDDKVKFSKDNICVFPYFEGIYDEDFEGEKDWLLTYYCVTPICIRGWMCFDRPVLFERMPAACSQDITFQSKSKYSPEQIKKIMEEDNIPEVKVKDIHENRDEFVWKVVKLNGIVKKGSFTSNIYWFTLDQEYVDLGFVLKDNTGELDAWVRQYSFFAQVYTDKRFMFLGMLVEMPTFSSFKDGTVYYFCTFHYK
jgi:hypothetical protein